jgi:uncharacterized DUF497 family protein
LRIESAAEFSHVICPARSDQNPRRVILEDMLHSQDEKRYYCLGEVAEGIMTVRFTYRSGVVRIFGAGYWRKGKNL